MLKRLVLRHVRVAAAWASLSSSTFACSETKTQTPVLEDVRLEQAFPNLTFERPVDLQHAGDGTERLFVLEQAGVIRVFSDEPSVTRTETFLDIRERVTRANNEEGLLGLAFHPNYSENGQFFVYYSAVGASRGVLARYQVDPDDPDRALEGSESILLEIPQPYGNHNGGQVSFGPDGYLYLALGDGGAGGDPHGHSQNRSTLLGSILRFDVDEASGGHAYGIPPDNPFVGNTEGYREEIYAYGLRNPWRFSWDARTGQLWTGDVGQDRFEEIDIIEKGKNYGWNTMEGSHCYEPPSGCDRSGLELPVLDYPREDGVSVTGGFVYRGSRVPALEGKYVYADFGTGRVWALTFDGKQAVENAVLPTRLVGIASFGVNRHAELFACVFDGKIYRFVQ
jgi:glucose/arabinose dehydrogenase